jgi:hypothetical protein
MDEKFCVQQDPRYENFSFYCMMRIESSEFIMSRSQRTRSNTGIVCSNPTKGMDVCVCFYYVFMLSCVGSGLPMG